MASCDPMESPSGLACEVIRNRRRAWIASQMSVFAVVAIGGFGRPRRRLAFQLVADGFSDAVRSVGAHGVNSTTSQLRNSATPQRPTNAQAPTPKNPKTRNTRNSQVPVFVLATCGLGVGR